ncbi:MAG: hypothetical protein NVS9B1_27660 [Candidatus Dormibacteraceae bacterium]
MTRSSEVKMDQENLVAGGRRRPAVGTRLIRPMVSAVVLRRARPAGGGTQTLAGAWPATAGINRSPMISSGVICHTSFTHIKGGDRLCELTGCRSWTPVTSVISFAREVF